MNHVDHREHKAELKAVLQEVLADMRPTTRVLKRFSTQISPVIYWTICDSPSARVEVRDRIRKVHDFYGWMAKPGAGRGNARVLSIGRLNS